MAPSTPTPDQRPEHKYDAEAAAWLYANSGDGFALLRKGRIVSVNPAWCRINGFKAEECIGQHALATIHRDDHHMYLAALAELQTRGETALSHRVNTGDGRLIWVELAVKQAEDGLFMVVLKDVTAARLQEEEQARAQQVDDMLRSSAKVYAWRFNPETGRYLSDRAPGMRSGPTRQQELSADEMAAQIHPDDQAAMGRAFNKTLHTGQPNQVWYRHVRPDGNWARICSTWQGGRQCANGLYEVLGLTQDMTELTEARDAALLGEKAAMEAAESKSRFLANMSHEIRTPLNGVLGVLHLLKNDGLVPAAADLVSQALACGEMLTQLLNDVLDFSKIEAGKLELNPEPLDPVATLNGVVDMMRPAAEARGLYLRTAVEGEPGWVSADPVRLRQVLFNLIGNATKFTLRGGVDVTLKSMGEGAAHRLRVEVRDTGVGIAPEAMSALFERFHQVDTSTTRRFGGTGLGLAITRSLVEQMGGEVHAFSTIGQGSTFSFEIDAPAASSVMPESKDDVAWLEGLRILVVEDNATNRLIATRMLESLGGVVETAHDGAEGVEAVERAAFDLIFMDVQMPILDGVEATRRIRRLPGPAAQTPIVAMTANVMKHQLAEYRAAGMDGAVAKPLNPAAILAELGRLSGQGEVEAA
jgi:PAS domain S-box-containing protein